MSTIDTFLNAMMQQESGGNSRAVNRHTGALGLWQVLPSNVTPWAKRYLGMNISPTQFLQNEALQRRLVGAVLGDYVKRYGYRGAASAWYSGNPALANHYGAQRFGPSIGSYVDSVMDRMGSTGFIGRMRNSVDAVATAFEQDRRSKSTFKPAADEGVQHTQRQAPIADLLAEEEQPKINEPQAVKGLGLSTKDGSGMGQLGMEVSGGLEGLKPVDEPMDSPLADPRNGALDSILRPMTDDIVRSSARDNYAGLGASRGTGEMHSPLPGYRPTFGFGETYSSKRTAGWTHRGVDFAAPSGTNIYLPQGGKIVSAGWENSGFGLAVRVQHSDGTYSIFGHLSTLGNIKPGQTLDPGSFLGKVGSTGDSSGAHLHWEKRRDLYDPKTAYDFTGGIAW